MHADGNVWLAKDHLYQWIKKLSQFLRFLQELFIINDIIANKNHDKRRQTLLKLAISGRHLGHYLSLLMRPYEGIPKRAVY